jgi:hypothetical protein
MGTKDTYMHPERIDETMMCEGVICPETGVGGKV